jgi:hypothetical protein
MYTTVSAIAVVVYFPFLKQSCVINNIEKERPRIKGFWKHASKTNEKELFSLSLFAHSHHHHPNKRRRRKRESKKNKKKNASTKSGAET